MCENVAIVDITCVSKFVWMISGNVYGVVRNVYVTGAFSVESTNGVLRGCAGKSIQNVVVNVTHAGTEGTVYGSNSSTNANTNTFIQNSYAIGNAATYSNITGETRTVYADAAAFLATEKANINAAKGWSEYWTFSEDGNTLYFGGNTVAENLS